MGSGNWFLHLYLLTGCFTFHSNSLLLRSFEAFTESFISSFHLPPLRLLADSAFGLSALSSGGNGLHSPTGPSPGFDPVLLFLLHLYFLEWIGKRSFWPELGRVF